ncbi:MAG: hypothetical protein ACPG31_05100 [Planctomycetota bacterium]
MTDWLDDILDQDSPEPVPEGFLARVMEEVSAEEGSSHSASTSPHSGGGRLLHFPQLLGMTAAAIVLVAAGFWMGHGARPMEQSPAVLGGPENAELDLEEMYRNRELLEAFDVLSDEDLEGAFLDAETGTWVLDYGEGTLPR